MTKKLRTKDGKLNVVGDRLAELRISMGESQNGIARLLQLQGWNVHKNAISQIEQGTRTVSDIELILLARVLKTTVDVLIKDTFCSEIQSVISS